MIGPDDREGIRRSALARRDRLHVDIRDALSWKITRRFLEHGGFDGVRTVMLSLSAGSEVSTDRLVEAARAKGLSIVVPVTLTADRRLLPTVLSEETQLVAGPFGIREPHPSARNAVPIDAIDLAVVPGAAFDPNGNRLGWGAGYYDRLLATLRPDARIVALAFECQLVSAVTRQPHDVSMDAIVTEDRVIETGGDRRVFGGRQSTGGGTGERAVD